VRFAKTGSDATTAAVRVSRAYTGRDRVLVCGYHGWHDWYAASTPRDKGIPPSTAGLVKKFVFNDPAGLAALVAARDVAAVVLEPSGIELPEPGFLAQVVEVCRRYGTVSVFDEMITGFRIAPGGVREKYGVCPDLSCYGKALGNGMPISVIAGTWEVMREFENVLFSGTYGGETLSLAAARAVLDAITSTDALARIEQTGRALQSGMRATIGRYGIADRVTVGGEPSRPVVAFGRDGAATKSWVQQCLAERGVLFDGTFNVCARHSPDDVRVALDAFDHACAAITEHPDMSRRLRSRPVAPGLRET
jgi:glutamate-1-semialdehyde aminotransferase